MSSRASDSRRSMSAARAPPSRRSDRAGRLGDAGGGAVAPSSRSARRPRAGASRRRRGRSLGLGEVGSRSDTIPAGRFSYGESDVCHLRAHRGRAPRRLARLGRFVRAPAPDPARLGRQHGLELRAAGDRRGSRALQHRAALARRRLSARARRAARDDGDARRPVRPSSHAAHRCHRFRVRLRSAAFAPTATLLIAARAGMGVFGAMLMPSTLSLLRTVFTNRDQRRVAVAIWAAGFSAGAALGPIVGGLLSNTSRGDRCSCSPCPC